jgi:hypothetical protein
VSTTPRRCARRATGIVTRSLCPVRSNIGQSATGQRAACGHADLGDCCVSCVRDESGRRFRASAIGVMPQLSFGVNFSSVCGKSRTGYAIVEPPLSSLLALSLIGKLLPLAGHVEQHGFVIGILGLLSDANALDCVPPVLFSTRHFLLFPHRSADHPKRTRAAKVPPADQQFRRRNSGSTQGVSAVTIGRDYSWVTCDAEPSGISALCRRM